MSNVNTLCVHGARDLNNTTGAIAVPVYQSAAFAHPAAGQSTGYDYSRLQNPTREVLEKTVAALESAYDAVAFSSGMAAMSVLCEMFAPGDHIIATDDLYGGSVRLLNNVVTKNGVAVDYANTADALEKHLRPNTKAVFVETPSNPMMHITDIAAVSRVCKEIGALLIVDNTFLTPVYQHPIELGADIVLHSGTKYLGGHNDTMAGFLALKNAELSEKIRFLAKTVGACLAPWDCFLIQRGIKTLAIRMERITENARKIAAWLESNAKISAVHYAGQSGMISFEVDGAQTARNALGKTKIITYAESLGGVESLLTYPILQTHADVPEDVRNALGITDKLLRLSVGIEDANDLIADLAAVLL